MKHKPKITLLILVMFLIAQLIGLCLINSYENYYGSKAKETKEKAIEKGIEVAEPNVSITKEIIPEKIEIKKPLDAATIVFNIMIAIVIALVLFLLLSYIGTTTLIRIWFVAVIFICLSIALTLLFKPLFPFALFSLGGKTFSVSELAGISLGGFLTFLKVKKRNVIVHNCTELLIYPGFALIFLPLLNWMAATLLLLLISVYDVIAVWKTKHMVKLAKFQIKKLKMFTGFFIPYVRGEEIEKLRKLKKSRKKKLKIKADVAVLGGGDIAFPLLFSGTLFISFGFLASLISVIFSTLGLAFLLFTAEKHKPYPAMPFITAGCLLSLAIILPIFS